MEWWQRALGESIVCWGEGGEQPPPQRHQERGGWRLMEWWQRALGECFEG